MATLAERARGRGPVAWLTATVIFLGNALFAPVSALLVLAWRSWTGTPWHELGFVRPRSWWRTIVVGVLAGVALKLLMKSVVMPLLGAPPTNEAYAFLRGNTLAAVGMLWSILVGAGFGEEVVFRGFLFERFGKWFGASTTALVVTVLLTTSIFAVVHYPVQKLPGVQQAFVTGLVMALIYARTRSLWLPMVLHAAFDLTALWIIYFDRERIVAGWFLHKVVP